jgi:anti-sigma factor ChrR (cupin superfamily)
MAEPNDEDAAFRALAALWDRRLAEAGAALEAEAPSPQVWDKIAARVDQLEAGRRTRTVAAEDGVWRVSSPGVWRKLLHVDAEGGWQAMLVRIEAGASVPPHAHPMLEECLVLEGEFELAGEAVRKGDLHLAFPGRDHAPIFSRAGALLYIRAAID